MNYQRFLNHTQSDTEPFNPKWLNQFMLLFITIVLLWIIYIAVDAFIYPLNYKGEYPFHMILSFLVLWKVHEGLCHLFQHYPKLLNNKEQLLHNHPEDKNNDWQHLMKKINRVIDDEKLFLQPKLTLTQLAKKVGSNDSYVSRAINQAENKNFNEFINQARITEAMLRMQSHTKESILDVAMASGFSSKSTFNRLFKMYHGQTPTQYKASL